MRFEDPEMGITEDRICPSEDPIRDIVVEWANQFDERQLDHVPHLIDEEDTVLRWSRSQLLDWTTADAHHYRPIFSGDIAEADAVAGTAGAARVQDDSPENSDKEERPNYCDQTSAFYIAARGVTGSVNLISYRAVLRRTPRVVVSGDRFRRFVYEYLTQLAGRDLSDGEWERRYREILWMGWGG